MYMYFLFCRTLKSFETFLRKGGRSTDYYIPPEVCVMMNTIIDCKNKVIEQFTWPRLKNRAHETPCSVV